MGPAGTVLQRDLLEEMRENARRSREDAQIRRQAVERDAHRPASLSRNNTEGTEEAALPHHEIREEESVCFNVTSCRKSVSKRLK